MTELKPCPFCGGEAEPKKSHVIAEHQYWIAYCYSCGARTVPHSSEEGAIEAWNTRPNPWHTGTPTVNDPFYVREVFILQFVTPKGDWYFHGHLFKPDFTSKRFRSWVDKNITFAFDCPDLRWQKITPYEENEDGRTD